MGIDSNCQTTQVKFVKIVNLFLLKKQCMCCYDV